MSTITRELAKLFRKITNSEIDAEGNAHVVLSPADSLLINNARIALASLEAEASGRNPVLAYADSYRNMANHGVESIPVWSVITDLERNIAPLFTAPPAPVSVPDAMEMDDDFDSAFEHGKAVGWNAYRAAMLQGADGTLTNEGTIPVTQFKPVADLYGITSPTGSETIFTFDAVEARDFIDGGWSCQEYVELERYQAAMTNQSEQHLDMVNSPVIPDGWVACSERMPEKFKAILAFNEYGEVWSGAYDRYWNFYCDNLLVEHVTHWMPLPVAPQQEAE
ncbi:DUF551 domain-containing protein [Citrobacter freundii]|uniref:DUF551 domain-containing protein n=1 Tax=Citrobacter freundii TaxID=546 RepID=UPI0023B3269D|nr:DUF551 domain-containing protein [Citrobacter freundii]MDE9635881.1 DUF551 domain-containing protein [Citrobacter freundii]HBU6123482.1 DUF551 domain-containing protein [Citrobacter freundii]HBU8580452.1 DUF551 domain-containing protein [Citrobacter freundii]